MVQFADNFDLSNGGKLKVEITLEMLKLPVRITKLKFGKVVVSSYTPILSNTKNKRKG